MRALSPEIARFLPRSAARGEKWHADAHLPYTVVSPLYLFRLKPAKALGEDLTAVMGLLDKASWESDTEEARFIKRRMAEVKREEVT